MLTIVGHDIARAMHAYEKLLQAPVRMFSADVLAGYSENQKISLDFERNVQAGLGKRQPPAQIFN
jgi:hypothetical protein